MDPVDPDPDSDPDPQQWFLHILVHNIQNVYRFSVQYVGMQREEIIRYTAVSMYGDSGEFITGSAWLLRRHVANVMHTGARICKPFREPKNRFPAWRTVTTTLLDVVRPVRLHRLEESIPRNQFLGSLNVCKFGLSHFFT